MRAEAVHPERPLQRHDGALDRLQENYRGQGRNRKVDAKLKRQRRCIVHLDLENYRNRDVSDDDDH